MKNKISMGIWGNTNLRDRFNINGFGEDVSVIDRIKQVGEIEGIDGIELHLPTEINDSNADEIEKVLNDYDLQIVQLCGHTWTEKHYKFGALGEADGKIRARAIDRVKAALMGMFQASENTVRLATFEGARIKAAAEGMEKVAGLDFARKVVETTQFLSGPAMTPARFADWR